MPFRSAPNGRALRKAGHSVGASAVQFPKFKKNSVRYYNFFIGHPSSRCWMGLTTPQQSMISHSHATADAGTGSIAPGRALADSLGALERAIRRIVTRWRGSRVPTLPSSPRRN